MSEDTAAMGSDSTTERVKEQVAEKAEVAQERASQATQQARGRFRDQVDQRSTQAGERLAGSAADARSVAEELRRQGKDAPARLVEQAAGQADRAAAYLKTASGDRISGQALRREDAISTALDRWPPGSTRSSELFDRRGCAV
jgi:hypothetical protein